MIKIKKYKKNHEYYFFLNSNSFFLYNNDSFYKILLYKIKNKNPFIMNILLKKFCIIN